MAKNIIDYYKEDMDRVDAMLREYTQYGYSPELHPIVEALSECYEKIKAEYKRLALEHINSL